jgi:hypothetical protein
VSRKRMAVLMSCFLMVFPWNFDGVAVGRSEKPGLCMSMQTNAYEPRHDGPLDWTFGPTLVRFFGVKNTFNRTFGGNRRLSCGIRWGCCKNGHGKKNQ